MMLKRRFSMPITQKRLKVIHLMIILLSTISIVAANILVQSMQPANAYFARHGKSNTTSTGRDAPIAASGNNVYTVWPNNDTGHWNVFFAKSTDGGKTLKIMIISAHNKGNVVDQNSEISASGSNVYVSWWTNKTGIFMPVFRASNDSGNTFAKTMMLNSTG
jgi:hypothetical protein